MDCKLKHLEFCQSAITRMAGNSFFLKGWAVTISAAVFAMSSVDKIGKTVIVIIIPILIFWFLDAYYLRQERLYRKLYDAIRIKTENEIDFSMNAQLYSSEVQNLLRTMFSISVIPFYFSMLLIAIILWKCL